ncbi:Protein of unknown function [Limimonas halophila]|uniref:DUF3565 domain-containing protein n=1 Tax=Limimonas halophila TaxID=1082479 RepID=A0A1G7UZ09_9PROT|nr:DUF3565 domain-containing protein [Limimonas halophila]SDG52538.1 Protein of unknown function [Limimonas halophila]
MSEPEPPQRAIVGFHQDDAGHWVAELACGHTRHMRHTPPFQNRAWVLTEAGRRAKLGVHIPCRKCRQPERFGPPRE